MSTENKTQSGFPDSAAEALIRSTLEDMRSIRDPSLLNACRSLFRSKVPFTARSYVAAALILKALGVETSPNNTISAPAEKAGKRFGLPRNKPDALAGGSTEEAGERGETGDQRLKKGRYSGEGTTLFFSMGRRQRFTARNVLSILSSISGIEESDIGIIRTFDNYSFVSVHPAAADLIIQDLDGTAYKGRKLAVNRARPKREAADLKTAKTDSQGEDQGGASIE